MFRFHSICPTTQSLRHPYTWKQSLIAGSLAICLVFSVASPVIALADDTFTWGDEQKQEAWGVYAVTEWNRVGVKDDPNANDLLFSKSGDLSSLEQRVSTFSNQFLTTDQIGNDPTVIKELTKDGKASVTYAQLVEYILSKSSSAAFINGDPTSYTNFFLCLLYEVQDVYDYDSYCQQDSTTDDDGTVHYPNSPDVACSRMWVTDRSHSASKMDITARSSIQSLISAYLRAEKTYSKLYVDAPSVFNTNTILSGLIVSTFLQFSDSDKKYMDTKYNGIHSYICDYSTFVNTQVEAFWKDNKAHFLEKFGGGVDTSTITDETKKKEQEEANKVAEDKYKKLKKVFDIPEKMYKNYNCVQCNGSIDVTG